MGRPDVLPPQRHNAGVAVDHGVYDDLERGPGPASDLFQIAQSQLEFNLDYVPAEALRVTRRDQGDAGQFVDPAPY